MQIGVHPVSAINNAEYVPIISEAIDAYLQANVRLAEKIGGGWIIGHGGYHFGDIDLRRRAALDRVRRLVEMADRAGIMVYLENHNKERFRDVPMAAPPRKWIRLTRSMVSGVT